MKRILAIIILCVLICVLNGCVDNSENEHIEEATVTEENNYSDKEETIQGKKYIEENEIEKKHAENDGQTFEENNEDKNKIVEKEIELDIVGTIEDIDNVEDPNFGNRTARD